MNKSIACGIFQYELDKIEFAELQEALGLRKNRKASER